MIFLDTPIYPSSDLVFRCKQTIKWYFVQNRHGKANSKEAGNADTKPDVSDTSSPRGSDSQSVTFSWLETQSLFVLLMIKLLIFPGSKKGNEMILHSRPRKKDRLDLGRRGITERILGAQKAPDLLITST